jgi:ribosomal protein S18 acetylase RimI-like enzyme
MAVAPGYRGRGWANLLLLTRAMERGWEAGARRLRLDVDETNLKSLHQSTRLNSVVLRRIAHFVRELGPD